MQSINRREIDGLRFYEVSDGDKIIGLFPSITTVLGQTKDQSGLDRWKQRIGEEEANRISTLSMNRGTVMHRLLELYKPIPGTQQEKLADLKILAATDQEVNQFKDHESGALFLTEGWKFFMKFWYNSSRTLSRVEEVLSAEEFLWTNRMGGYAGTVDNVSKMFDKGVLIIDYKNSRRPKEQQWIQDYFMQGSAYYIAYWDRTGIKPNGVEIWIANEEDAIPQVFSLEDSDVKFYFKEFVKRLKQFHSQRGVNI
jgi:genome maintenance exonuclease 1